MRPVAHSEELPVPKPPENVILSDDEQEEDFAESCNDDVSTDPNFEASCSSAEPQLLTQGDLNDLVRDQNLSKRQAELLSSRLKGWNLLRHKTNVGVFRNRQNDFKNFFDLRTGLLFVITLIR